MRLGTNIKYSGSGKKYSCRTKKLHANLGSYTRGYSGVAAIGTRNKIRTESTNLVLGYCIPGIQMILPDQHEARQRCPRIRTFTSERTGTASLTPWHGICAFVLQHL